MSNPSSESTDSSPPKAQPASEEKSSYGQILKSTALIGGTSVVNIVVGVVRSKAIALMLGPSGVGLNGMYGAITGMAETIAGMGINSSGVRQIAEAAGTQDQARVAKTAAVLRWTSLVLGLAGAVVLVTLSPQISTLTFGDTGQTVAVCILALGVLCKLVSAGQGALLQGLRQISDMARVSVLSAVIGTLVTIPLVYFLRERGVALAIAATSLAALAASWWYSRQLAVETPTVTAADVRSEAKALLHLGSALMVSSLVTVACAYAIRAAIFQQLGADATGLYQAAWTLGGLYVGFILQAMGSDFYPRLTAVAEDNAECNRLVNEQARVSLLLAGTGIVGTLTFASVVINIFYSSSFQPAVDVLRWICLGTALQVVSWPMGYIVLAKGEKGKLLWCELSWAAVHLGLAWACVGYFGLAGAGIAFFGSYVFHIGLTYAIANRLSGFHWSRENRNTTLMYLAMIGTVFYGMRVLPPVWAMSLGGAAMVLCGVYSLWTLTTLVSLDAIPRPLQRLLGCFGLAVPAP
jgi:enterobacterial common antigen flippase